ncbi:MAG TPA: ABC transporter permease [Stellaceae bacterium]|nr:ABC transporter permease [Stellaceae bacterium]
MSRVSEIAVSRPGLKKGPETSGLAGLWQRQRTPITRTAAALVFLGVWEWSVRAGMVDPLFLSSPTQVAARLFQVFADGTIWPHLWASGVTAFWGFFLSCAVGVPIGVLMGRSVLLRDTLEPFIMAQASIPTVALLPLFIIWLGIGVSARIALVFVGAVFGIVVSTEAGVSNIDRRLIETARSFTATEWEILWKIVMPAALPYIIAGMRLAIARVLIMVVVAELYASTAGVGYLIFQAGASYDTSMIFVGVVILAAAGVGMNTLLRAIEWRIAPWAGSRE